MSGRLGGGRPSKGLDDREQRYAYIAAGLAAVASVVLWAPAFRKGAAIGLTVSGLLMAAFLALAAKRRRRLVTGLAAVLLAFGPWGMAWVLGLPFLVLASWLALRSSGLQPRLDAEVDEHGNIVAPVTAAVAVADTHGSPKKHRSRRRGGDDDAESAASASSAPRKAPPQSKRYTPPQPRR